MEEEKELLEAENSLKKLEKNLAETNRKKELSKKVTQARHDYLSKVNSSYSDNKTPEPTLKPLSGKTLGKKPSVKVIKKR